MTNLLMRGTSIHRAMMLITCVMTALSLLPPKAASHTSPFHVAVVHRHGARSTIVSVNQSGVCPPSQLPDGGCGTLTSEGKDMLYHLGRFLADAYGGEGGPFEKAIHTNYDSTRFLSRSTDVGRTIQSGSAMIRGLFAAFLCCTIDPRVKMLPFLCGMGTLPLCCGWMSCRTIC
jgi:hypothetical protein